MVGFLKGYRAGVEWLYQPANREIVEALLVANIRDMTPALARQSYDLLLAQPGGIYRDARPDLARHRHGARAAQQVRDAGEGAERSRQSTST